MLHTDGGVSQHRRHPHSRFGYDLFMVASGLLPNGPRTERLIGQPLDRFAAAAAAAEGLRLADLAPTDVLEVRTRNTRYLISTIAIHESRVVVTGGRFFPLPREAQLVGATLGGSAVKLGWIGCGFCLELLHGGERIVTTRVREIRVIAGAGPPN
jgi:hypothetical protein